MPWLPDYQQTQWGSPPQLHAAPIEGLVRSIWALRAKQQEDVQNSLVGAINEFHRNKVANALTGQYAQEGLIPQELAGEGAMGAGAATDYIKAQQYKTTPTDIGGGTNLNLTDAQRLSLAIHNNAIRARASSGGGSTGGGVDTSGGLNIQYDPYGNPYVVGPRGGVKAITRGTGTSSSKPGKPAPGSADELYNKWGLQPEELHDVTGLERVTIKDGAVVADPQGNHVRVKGGPVMPFDEYLKYARPKGGGADKAGNLAQDYGAPQAQVAKSREEAQPGQSYYAPDGTIRTRTN